LSPPPFHAGGLICAADILSPRLTPGEDTEVDLSNRIFDKGFRLHPVAALVRFRYVKLGVRGLQEREGRLHMRLGGEREARAESRGDDEASSRGDDDTIFDMSDVSCFERPRAKNITRLLPACVGTLLTASSARPPDRARH